MPSRTDLCIVLCIAILSFVGGRFLGASTLVGVQSQETDVQQPSRPLQPPGNRHAILGGHQNKRPELVPISEIIKDDKWTSLREEYPQRTSAITNALVMEMARLVREKGESPYDCNIDGELVGEFALEFRIRVESTASRLRADGLRFVGVRTGSPLSSSTVQCLEELLGASIVVRESNGDFLDGYTGEVPMTYRIDFGNGSRPLVE